MLCGRRLFVGFVVAMMVASVAVAAVATTVVDIPARDATQRFDAFAARAFAVALVDQTSDGKIRQYGDIREVVRYVRGRDSVPTWIEFAMAIIGFIEKHSMMRR